MAKVVSNSSPLNYLILIDAVGVLPILYREIWIPTAVQNELSDPAAPAGIRRFVATPPDWLRVRPTPATKSAGLDHLDAGEAEAILLAREIGADALLIDDRDGVRAARERDLRVIGTLGVLDRAAESKLVDIRAALDRLQRTNFRIPAGIIARLLSRYRDPG
ncbi:MAG: DUF3368 domain-containing protein [Gammaproteobacteria bacterium]